MNKPVRFILNITTIALFFLAEPCSCYAQDGSSWWKNIFRSECDTTQVVDLSITTDSTIMFNEDIYKHNDSTHVLLENMPVLEKRIGLGIVQMYMDSSIMIMNLNALEQTKPVRGYRVQIHFGGLESARAVRAKCRLQIADQNVYMESIAPNYIVSVGNYRDRWEAEFELGNLKKLYPNAVIVPTDIEFTKL